jgi:hypothetical protein
MVRAGKGAELTETYLRKLCGEVLLIQVRLGQKFDSIFTAILRRGAHRCGVVKLQGAAVIDMTILGRWGAGNDLANVIDDGIATGAKFTHDLELPSRILVVCDGSLLGGLVGGEAKNFTQERNSLTD